jgi:hypothetical protein
LALEEKHDALSFETDLSAVETYGSSLVIDVTVEQQNGPFPLVPRRRIKLKDFKPEYSTSEEDGISDAESSVTILDMNNDFVRFQRIESMEFLSIHSTPWTSVI